MNQEKIGKFIAKLRKDNKMTQQELADKLNVTDRAIGNWENGRRMPDVIFFKSLCEIFNISINELLSGEKIKKEDLEEKSKEIIISTMDYSNKRIKHTKLTFTIIISIILILFITLATLFGIDIVRMRNNQSVFFSTWGFDYYPPINLDEKNIEKTIKDYLIKEDEENNHYENEKSFVAMKIYLISEEKDSIIVYAWILQEKYYQVDNVVSIDSESSIPYKFTLKKENNNYNLENYEIPRDGSYYERDAKRLFPNNVLKNINNSHRDGTIEKLKFEIQEQVTLYYHN